MLARYNLNSLAIAALFGLVSCAYAVTPALSLEIELEFPEPDTSEDGERLHPFLSQTPRGPTKRCGQFAGTPYWCRSAGKSKKHGRLVVVLPPYPTLDLRAGVYRPNAILESPILGWARIDQVIDGKRVVERLRKRAASGEVFCQSDKYCVRIAKAWSERDGRRVHGLAECYVRKIGNRYSPPISCDYRHIVIDHGRDHGQYIWAVRAYAAPLVFGYAGRRDFSVGIPKGDKAEFINSLAKRLEDVPYSAFTQVGDSRLDAAGDYKYFSPLGLFSVFTISIYEEGTMGENAQFAVATSLNISAQTGSNEESYRLAPRPTFNKFLETIRNTILAELQQFCPNFSQSTSGFVANPRLRELMPFGNITVTKCK